jgi:hypothetical protein
MMAPPISFDPDRVAFYETEGWRAYYDRRWLRAFWLLVQLNRYAFGMTWPWALAAAWDTVCASRAFAPLDNDLVRTRAYLEKFFGKAKRFRDIPAGAAELAGLELNYWVVHRQLAIRRSRQPDDEDIEPMIEALARLHAALFNATPALMRPSAEWRGLAAKTVDEITGHRSQDIAPDWQQVEAYLRQAYRAVPATVRG